MKLGAIAASSAVDAAETDSDEEVALAVKKAKAKSRLPPVSRESSGAAARAVDSEQEPSSSAAAHDGGGLSSSSTGHKSNAPRVSPRKRRTQPSKLDAGGDLVRKSRRSHPRKNYNEDEVAEADFDDVINEEDESDNSGSSERENRR